MFLPLLHFHFENDCQLDRRAERETCNPIHQTAGVLVLSEDILQQVRSGVSHFRLLANISGSGHQNAEPDDPCHFVERSQMLPRDGEGVERREASGLARRVHIEIGARSPRQRAYVERVIGTTSSRVSRPRHRVQ